jgi:hypothetical protein
VHVEKESTNDSYRSDTFASHWSGPRGREAEVLQLRAGINDASYCLCGTVATHVIVEVKEFQ